MPDIEPTILASLQSGRQEVEPGRTWTSSPRLRAAPRRADALPFGLGRMVDSATASHQLPVWISMTGDLIFVAAATWAGSGAMNSETRMPAGQGADNGLSELCWPADRACPRWCRSPGAREPDDGMRAGPQRDRQHLLSGRHLEVERAGNRP
jgi:hypothetical protein